MLLALLALEPGTQFSPERIVEVLWDSGAPREPAHNIATMVSRIRRTLGSASIAGDRAGYRLSKAVRVDLHDAAALVEAAEAGPTGRGPLVAFNAARRALRLLNGGGVLDDEPSLPWIESARVLHQVLLRRARVSFAESALRIGKPDAAQSAAESALAADPIDEASCRLLMRAYAATGEPARAIEAYQRVRSALANDLGLDPAPATLELYVTILRGSANLWAPGHSAPRSMAGLTERSVLCRTSRHISDSMCLPFHMADEME